MKFTEIMQSADWKAEKHIPVIESVGNAKSGEKITVSVTVGKEIGHPNTTEHHIRWIKLFFKPANGKFAYEIGSYEFNAHGESIEGANKGPVYTEPMISTTVKLNATGVLLATAYCNIHGLWESSAEVAVTE